MGCVADSAGYLAAANGNALRGFRVYRFCVANLLFASAVFAPAWLAAAGSDPDRFQLAITGLYLAATTGTLLGTHGDRRRFNGVFGERLCAHLLIDLLVLTLLIHEGGGLHSPLWILVLATLAGATRVGRGRVRGGCWASATLAVLYELFAGRGALGPAAFDFFQAGLLCVALLGVALSGRSVSRAGVDRSGAENDARVFPGSQGHSQARAKQSKLAALGRLTAQVAHEIRNPLSAIHHAGELLKAEALAIPADRRVRIILDNVRRVERIVSDVLELGLRDRMRAEAIDLRQTLPRMIEADEVAASVDPAVFRFEFSGPAKVVFDHSHFHQVMWNLFGNALRHSRKRTGSILVSVSDDEAPGRIRLRVSDDGPGVDEACRAQIFEPFFSTQRRGTGLGLYVVRELCEANGARVELLPGTSGANFCIFGKAA